MNLEIDLEGSDQLFTSLAELQGYDCVVLANVPRSSGEDSTSIPASEMNRSKCSFATHSRWAPA